MAIEQNKFRFEIMQFFTYQQNQQNINKTK